MQKDEVKISVDALFWRISLKDDEEAFRILFYNFFPPLTLFAMRYISDKETCEDIVQETFLKIWKNRKSFEITTSARNFLLTSVKNSCLDYLKKKEVEIRYQESQLLHREPNYTLEDIYTLAELEAVVNKALERLPENIRLIFEKNRFEGKTYREIADEQQISIKTVESYISKALKFLRVELKDYYPFCILFLW